MLGLARRAFAKPRSEVLAARVGHGGNAAHGMPLILGSFTGRLFRAGRPSRLPKKAKPRSKRGLGWSVIRYNSDSRGSGGSGAVQLTS
jgi:hypothetical protein